MDHMTGLAMLGNLLWLVPVLWLMARFRGRRGDGLSRARAVLHRRLASGEIDVEEYYERESALRQAAPPARRRHPV